MNSILRRAFSTLIVAAVLSTGGYAVNAEVNPRVLANVQNYYKINLAKGRGCNWFQVLMSFDHEPATNPLNCVEVPYTAEQAKNKPWAGWVPVQAELERLEKIREEELRAQVDALDQDVQPSTEPEVFAGLEDSERSSHNQNDLPEIWLDACDTHLSESRGRWVCLIRAGKEDRSKLVNSIIKYEITESGGARVETGKYTFVAQEGLNIGAIDISWEDDDIVYPDSNIVVRLLPTNNYKISDDTEELTYSNKVFKILEDDIEINLSSAGCTGRDSITGYASEEDEEIICHFEIYPQQSGPVTVNYTISEFGENRVVTPKERDQDGFQIPSVRAPETFKFPADKHTHSVVVGTWTDNSRYTGDSEVTLTLNSGDDYTLGISAETKITINDDDTEKPVVSFDWCSKQYIGYSVNTNIFYEGQVISGTTQSDRPVCFISSSIIGWPDKDNPLRIKVTKSGSHRNMIIDKPKFEGVNDFGESTIYTDTVSISSEPIGTSSVLVVRNDVVNSGPTFVTFEVLPSEDYITHPSKSITIEIKDDDTDPQDIQIGLMKGDTCNTTDPLEINEDGSTELCLKTNGFDRNTSVNMILDQDEGGFIHDMKLGRNVAQKITISPATPNGTKKHITRGIYVPVKSNGMSGNDGSVRITFEGTVDGQYNSVSKKAVIKDDGHDGDKIQIEYQHDPNVNQPENNLGFKVFPPNGFKRPLKIAFSCSGYNYYCYQEFTINSRGQLIKLDVDPFHKDQVEIPLNVTFEVVQGNYQIVDDDINQTILVADDEPTRITFAENTMSREGITEGAFTVIAQFRVEKPHPVNFSMAKMVFDFPLDSRYSGCEVRDFEDGGLKGQIGKHGKLPCRIDLNHNRATKLGIDSWQIDGSIPNGFAVQLQTGEDEGSEDGRIKFRPEVTFLNSGGGVDISDIPESLVVYDNDNTDRGYVLDDNGNPALAVLNFTLSEYTVVENNGPAQPVIRISKCRNLADTRDVTCTRPIINLSPIIIEVIPGTAKKEEDYTISDTHLVSINNLSNISDPDSSFLETVWPARVRGPVTNKFDVHTVRDGVTEGDEYFDIRIVEELLPQGFKIGNTGKAKVLIRDSDKGYRAEYIFTSNNNKNFKNDNQDYNFRTNNPTALPQSADNWGYDTPGVHHNGSGSANTVWFDDESDVPALSLTNRYLWRAERRVDGNLNSGDQVTIGGGHWDPRDIIKVKEYNKPGATVNSDEDGVIVDNHPEGGGVCPKDSTEEECPLKVHINIDGDSINESDIVLDTDVNKYKLELNINFTSNRDLASHKFIDFKVENTIGKLVEDEGIPGMFSAKSSTEAGITVERGVTLYITGYQPSTSFEPRQIKLTLTGPEAIEGNEVLLWITNDNKTDVKVKLPSDAPADWQEKPSDNNKFIVGIDDLMNEHQVLQVPIVVNDSSNTTLPPSDYELELVHSKDNIHLTRNQSGEYTLTIKGHTNKTYNCGADIINSSGQACIRFINKKVMTDSDNEYTVNITVDGSNGSYGTTSGLVYEKHSTINTVTKKVKPYSLARTTKTISIVDRAGLSDDPANTGYLKVDEPPKGTGDGVNRYRFDVVIDPPPSIKDNGYSRVTEFKFCVVQSGEYTYERETKSTYADYYSDFRITGTGGGDGRGDTRAFNKDTGCTLGERMNTDKENYILWVHRDAWDDTDEKIHLSIRLVNNPDNITTVEHNSSNPFKYIIKNDGTLVEDYLRVSGHAKASYIADIVKRRVTGPADREPGITIIPGGSPGDTDPDVILEEGTFSAISRSGWEFYIDVSKLSFSGTGENNVSSDIRVITLGADKRWDSFLVGSGFSIFRGGGEWTQAKGGNIQEKSWALFPYAAYYSGRLTVYGSLSFGEGSIVLSPNKIIETDTEKPTPITADTKWRAYIVGADYILVNTDKLTVSLFGDYFDQETKTENSVETPNTSASTYRLRAGLSSLLKMDNSDLRLSVSYDKDTFSDSNLGLGMGLSMRLSDKLSAEINYSKSGAYSSVGVSSAWQISNVWRAGAHANDNDVGAELQGNLSF